MLAMSQPEETRTCEIAGHMLNRECCVSKAAEIHWLGVAWTFHPMQQSFNFK